MPIAVDHGRRFLSVPKRVMPAILAIHSGDRVTPAESAELEAGGILRRRALDPLVVALLDVITNPTLVVTVEAVGVSTPRLATIWGSEGHSVLGRTVDRHQFDLLQIEPDLLPFHLAQVTRLSPRPLSPFHGAVAMPRATLQRVEHLIARDQLAAELELRHAGLVDPWPDWLLIALAHRRALWTVEAVWLDGRERRVEQMSFLDAGSAGYWLVKEDADRGSGALVVSSFDQLLRSCAALLPRELR